MYREKRVVEEIHVFYILEKCFFMFNKKKIHDFPSECEGKKKAKLFLITCVGTNLVLVEEFFIEDLLLIIE